MNTPLWAQNLVLDACLWWENQGNTSRLPTLKWRHSRHFFSSGHAHYGEAEITITAGTDRHDQRMVLLHELAHILRPRGHTAAFWGCAWSLFRWAGLPIRKTLARESGYMKGAAIAYRRNRRS